MTDVNDVDLMFDDDPVGDDHPVGVVLSILLESAVVVALILALAVRSRRRRLQGSAALAALPPAPDRPWLS